MCLSACASRCACICANARTAPGKSSRGELWKGRELGVQGLPYLYHILPVECGRRPEALVGARSTRGAAGVGGCPGEGTRRPVWGGTEFLPRGLGEELQVGLKSTPQTAHRGSRLPRRHRGSFTTPFIRSFLLVSEAVVIAHGRYFWWKSQRP